MVISKQSKIFNFTLFIIPALALYVIFFITPLVNGVQYSFTDWNGIIPVVPLNIEKVKFESALAKLTDKNDIAHLKSSYEAADDSYNLNNWVTDKNGDERQLNDAEKNKLKNILAKAGISQIKFIGLDNYIEMFKGDARFTPRMHKNFLFKEYDELLPSIARKTFEENLIANIGNSTDKNYIKEKYKYDSKSQSYILVRNMVQQDIDKLTALMAKYMYKNIFIPGVLGFTLFFTFFAVIGANIFALAIALALDTKMKTTNALRSIFFLPNVLSLIIVAFIWSFVFRLILPAITGIDVWLGDTTIAPYAVVVVSVWQSAGYLMIIYLAGLQTIPQDIIEVAELDGANWIQRFKNITLPLLIPSITICTFYSIANSLKGFEVPFALTSGGPDYATTNIVLDIYYNSFNLNRFAYGTAKSVFLCLIIMLITGIQLYIMKRKEVEL